MTEFRQIYKCEICGNIVEVLHTGVGELVCCGQPMKLMKEQTADEGKEKHVPVVERREKVLDVKVGSVPHPMEEKHYIEWVEIFSDGTLCRRFLKPGNRPESEFCLVSEKLESREYCNVHGLWKS
ncbi:MAG: desulfoferrodoxin [Candidatus Aenigmarchaeota archaeon]|nr:desulfoferrodoxin [Candidatus Aenigmarchaeota archaeon]